MPKHMIWKRLHCAHILSLIMNFHTVNVLCGAVPNVHVSIFLIKKNIKSMNKQHPQLCDKCETELRVLFLHVFIYFLVSNIYIWTFSTAPKCTFPVWKCMIRLRICAHCRLFHIRCFGINMTPMWHHCIFICFIYVMC